MVLILCKAYAIKYFCTSDRSQQSDFFSRFCLSCSSLQLSNLVTLLCQRHFHY